MRNWAGNARGRWSRIPLLLVMVMFLLTTAHADEGLSVTVTPPLFQLTIGPGESWASTLKIVNNNTYDVTYYARVVDMEASGEDGRSKFMPLVNIPQDVGAGQGTLARWISISAEPFTVPRGKSVDLPFAVLIPKNAEPGGHYAAILVGTEPGNLNVAGSLMKVSSFVSSLFFVKIKGDIIEDGNIREFRSEKTLYEVPQADFVLRFENTGNTHLKPEGDIAIYNMWGKVRGNVLINQDTSFGNVLPKSVRKFQFSWVGEQSLFEFGRYSAIVTLTYGEDGKKNVSETAYFWVIPIVPVAVGAAISLILVVLLIWLIRRYIRRALMLERIRLGTREGGSVAHVRQPVIETIIQPIREGVIDLRSVSHSGTSGKSSGLQPQIPLSREELPHQEYRRSLTPGEFLAKYRLFFLFLVVVILTTFGVLRYFHRVLVPQRNFEIKDVKIGVEAL